MIQRRDFITLVSGAAVWSLAARAQQGERVRRIGVLMSGDENDPVRKTWVPAFIQALAGLGWVDGRNVRMDLRWGGTDANRIRALAKELVGLQPDIILAGGTTGPLPSSGRRGRSQSSTSAPTPSLRALSSGSTSRAGMSPASPRWKLR